MMKRIRTALFYVVLINVVVTLGAATRPKFQPSGPGDAGIGRYVVTLAEDTVGDDLGALKRELALTYGARLEANASSDVQRFVVTMLPARARLLSADPRVGEVAEVPLTTTVAASPETSAVGLPSAPSPRYFTPQPSGFGDNGQSGTYTYDGAGNITAIGADTYRYDTAQRLVSSVTRGVQEDYSYDAFGNRKSATGAVNCLAQTTCAQTVAVDSNTNHLTTINGAAVTYDDAGNIKTIAATAGNPGAAYTYDGTGMMTEATVGSDDRQFLYTADDERIAVRQGSSWTWTVRDLSGKVLREFTSLESGPNLEMTRWQWTKDYVWRDGLLLATTTPTGTLHYHLDHLGTPRLVTDSNGVKVAEHAYYPFGAEINLTPHENPEEAMKFTGHERDIVAGDGHTLDYMHARYYSPLGGRFLGPDPVLGDPQSPQSWNRYTYARNNPTRYTDPDGRCTVDGETHGVIWCFAHTLSFVQTQHEHAQSIRKELSAQGIVIVQNGRSLDSRKMSDAQVVAVYQNLLEQDRASGRPNAAAIPLSVLNTLNTINRTGAAPEGHKGGRQFSNDGRDSGQVLPKTDATGRSITYREWDVKASQPGVNRGTERLVTGSDGSAWYTNDHYQTFVRIK